MGVYKVKFRPREPLHGNMFWMSKIDRHFDLIISILCISSVVIAFCFSLLKGLLYSRLHFYSKTHNTNHVAVIWSFHRNNEYKIVTRKMNMTKPKWRSSTCLSHSLHWRVTANNSFKMLLRFTDKTSFHIVLHLNKSQFDGLDYI